MPSKAALASRATTSRSDRSTRTDRPATSKCSTRSSGPSSPTTIGRVADQLTAPMPVGSQRLALLGQAERWIAVGDLVELHRLAVLGQLEVADDQPGGLPVVAGAWEQGGLTPISRARWLT